MNKMFNAKFACTMIAMIISIFAIANFDNTVVSSEGFVNAPRTTKVIRTVADSRAAAAKGQFYAVPGTYQSALAPRAYGGQYGAYINYKMPEQKNLAVPSDPLAMGQMAESYCGSCTSGSCGTKKMMKESFEAPAQDEYPSVTNMIPVGDMTTVNADGETMQPVVYDRLIYANRNSRLRSQGDMIRGDLAIAPQQTGWFQVSATPNVDLQQGAMNVLAGPQNETTQALTALINQSSGGVDKTIAGVDIAMTPMYAASLSAGQNDIQVTAFP